MTKHDFETVARGFQTMTAVYTSEFVNDDDARVAMFALTQVANELARSFALGNNRFDRGRFLAACGVTDQWT